MSQSVLLLPLRPSRCSAWRRLRIAQRKEIKRTDLTGTNMEVILSVAEYKPGDLVTRHIHHGVEAFYVIQGATVQTPDGKEIKLATGAG